MPIHIAITRRVRPGCEAEFQGALRDLLQTSFAHGGALGASMLFSQQRSVQYVRGGAFNLGGDAAGDALVERWLHPRRETDLKK